MAKPRNNLKKIRKLLNKSQGDLESIIGKSRQTIGKIENGDTLLEYNDAKLISNFLNVPMDILFEDVFLSPELLSKIKNGKPLKKDLEENELIVPHVVTVNENNEELVSIVEIPVHASYVEKYMDEEFYKRSSNILFAFEEDASK